MKDTHTHEGFEFRFDADGMSLSATRARMPERTFEVLVVFTKDGPCASCGFVEFIEVGEVAHAIATRVVRKLHETMLIFPGDFSEPTFRDALSHWLLFNFGTPLRH